MSSRKAAAGKVTPSERQRARLHDRDRGEVERIGISQAARIGFRLQRDVLAAVKRGGRWPELREIIRRAMEKLSPLVLDGMLVAHVKGIVQATGTIDGQTVALSLAAGEPHEEAIKALRRRAKMSVKSLDVIQEQYDARGLRVLDDVKATVEKKLQQTLLETTAAGEHVREGVKAFRTAFEDLGITPDNKFTFENLFRTQTQLAYGAGRWQAGQDEAIQEILWGYKYVTVWDERVRPEHAGLDGVTAPKGDSIWQSIWPPNGFSCRCSTIEIFEPQEAIHPPAVVEIDGKEYRPGPDKGFAYNPGQLFGLLGR